MEFNALNEPRFQNIESIAIFLLLNSILSIRIYICVVSVRACVCMQLQMMSFTCCIISFHWIIFKFRSIHSICGIQVVSSWFTHSFLRVYIVSHCSALCPFILLLSIYNCVQNSMHNVFKKFSHSLFNSYNAV